MRKTILIGFAVVLAAGLYLALHRSGGGDRPMEKASQALLPYGASLALSSDCDHWIAADEPGADAALKSLTPSPAKFNFLKLTVPALGDSLIALDASPGDLLTRNSKGEVWLAERDGRIVNLSTEGYVGVTPAAMKLDASSGASAGASSALELIAALGRNTEHVATLMRDPGHGKAFFVQRSGKDFLVCGEDKGCGFLRNQAKVADPEEIAAMKKNWDRAPMSGIGAVCKSLGDAAVRDTLNRYDVIDGACRGKLDVKALKASYQERVADCAGYTDRIAPQAEAFFAITSGEQ